jgi:hypothetical protein
MTTTRTFCGASMDTEPRGGVTIRYRPDLVAVAASLLGDAMFRGLVQLPTEREGEFYSIRLVPRGGCA